MSEFIGCSPHIQQAAAANLFRKSYTYLLNAAAFWLQPAVIRYDVLPIGFGHRCCKRSLRLTFYKQAVSVFSYGQEFQVCHPHIINHWGELAQW